MGELPGCKRNLGEMPQQALRKLIAGDLAPLEHRVRLESSMQENFEKDSPTYGMPTTYLRTVHTAFLEEASPRDSALMVAVASPSVSAPSLMTAEGQRETPTVYAIESGKDEVTYYCWLAE